MIEERPGRFFLEQAGLVFERKASANFSFDQEEIQIVDSAVRLGGDGGHSYASEIKIESGCAPIFTLADEIDDEAGIADRIGGRANSFEDGFERDVLIGERFPNRISDTHKKLWKCRIAGSISAKNHMIYELPNQRFELGGIS